MVVDSTANGFEIGGFAADREAVHRGIVELADAVERRPDARASGSSSC